MNSPSIGILGAGNMALAIVKGIISADITTPDRIFFFDISEERRALFESLGFTAMPSSAAVVERCETVVLSVKPQNFAVLFEDIKGSLSTDKLLISIAAGVSIARIKELAGIDLPVIRVLPNTPMQLSVGASVIASEPPVSDEQLKLADSIFSSCGITKIIPEESINTTLSIHSSSPAFLFLFAKIVSDYAQSHNIDRETSTALFSQTLRGCAEMLDNSGLSTDQLIRMVTSPHGTTEAALEVFDRLDFSGTVFAALERCKERGDELGRA